MKRQSFSKKMGFESPLAKQSVFHAEFEDAAESQYHEEFIYSVIFCKSGVEVFEKYNSNKDLRNEKHLVIYYEQGGDSKNNLFGTSCRVKMGRERRDLMQKLIAGKTRIIVNGYQSEAQNLTDWSKIFAYTAGKAIDAKVLEDAVKFELAPQGSTSDLFNRIFALNNDLADWISSGVSELEKWKFTEENYEFAKYGENLKPILPISIFKKEEDFLYTGKQTEKKLATQGLSNLIKLYNRFDNVLLAEAFALTKMTLTPIDDVFVGVVWLVKEVLEKNLSPQLKKLLLKIKAVIKVAIDFFDDIQKTAIETIAVVNAALCGIANGLISLLQMILGLVAFAVDNIPILEVEKISKSTINSFQEKLEIVEDMIDIVQENISHIFFELRKLIGSIGKNISTLIQSLKSKLPNISKYYWAYIIGAIVFELILDAIIAFFTGGTALAVKITESITRLSAHVAKKGLEFAGKKATKAVAKSTTALQAIKALFLDIIEALKNGKFIEWLQEKLLSLLKSTTDEATNLLKTIYSKFGQIEMLSKSKGGKEVLCLVHRRVHIPVDKILKYARGSIDDVVNKKKLIDEFYELKKLQKNNPKAFASEQAKRLKFLEDTTHNPRRSLQNKAVLDKAGIPDNDEWNKKIFDAIVNEAQNKLPSQYGNIGQKVKVDVVMQGGNGKVILTTEWEKIDYAKFWMNTIINKTFK